MNEKRVALDKFAEAIHRDDLIIAILPTGYGKTSFFEHHPDLITTKTVHVLPLQAIVQQFYNKMSNVLRGQVGYQMALQIADQKEGKRPYLSRKYMITTVDSYVLDFYGIPVHEIFRSKWHSDLALLFARTSNLILDEFHLMAPVDTTDAETKAETEFTKVIEVFKDIINSVSELGLKTMILTATLSPYLLSYLFNSNYQGQNKKIIILAPSAHKFISYLENKGVPKELILRVWSNDDDFVSKFSDYTKRVKTKIVYTESKKWTQKVKEIIDNHKSNKDKQHKILVILNHTSRVIELGNELKEECFFIHGLFGDKSKAKFVENLNKGMYSCVIATQVLEAGVDIDFDVLITDVAPAYSLIQRAGRVLRKPDDSREGYIYILEYKDKDGIDEQTRWVYSEELTLKTLESLKNPKYANNCYADGCDVAINWRLAEKNENKYDYLQLLADIDSYVEKLIDNKKSNISSTLKFLSNVTTSPYEAITTIDEKFKGSFIRSASLVSLVIKPDDKNENEEIVTVSWDRFVKLIYKKKKLKFLYAIKTKEDEMEYRRIEVNWNEIYREKPLTSLHRIIRKARKEAKIEDDFMSGYIKIVGKGFEIDDPELVKIYDKGGNKYYYLDLRRIPEISGA